nr:retrotransposon protein, putative, unclassified [Tanacetum cinerariifolium]
MVLAVVLTQSKLVFNTVVRPVSAVVPKINVTRLRYAHPIVTKSKLPIRRHITRSSSPKTSNLPLRVTAVKASVVSVAQGMQRKWGNPQHALKDKRVINSGCLRHMTGNMSYLSDFKELNGGCVAFGGNLKGGKIYGKGKIKTCKLDFDDVYFVKELKFFLFSVSQMCYKKNSVLFTDTECLVLSPDFKLPDEIQVLLRVPRENNMYNVNLKNIVSSMDLTCLFAKVTIDESNLWHRRLGHINFKTINKLVKGNLVKGLPTKVFENDKTYVACMKGKKHRVSCKTKHVFFLATKDETSPILKTFITGLENQISLKVKVIRSDNGNEFKNNDLNQFCRIKRIKREFSVPRTPQQNGIAEKKNRTLIEDATTMLADLLLPIPFWAEPVNTAYYVQNGVLVTKPRNKTHYELLHGKTPSTGFMRPFSCPMTILNTLDPLDNIKGKNSLNNTNTFSAVGPSNAVASPTYGKSSFIDASKLLDDQDMPELEDITYSDDENDVLVDLPHGKRAIGTKWVYRNKKDEREIMITNKARLVTQGHTQKEGINYEKVFAPVARIEAIRLFLAYAPFMGFIVYQMDVNSAFLYGTIEEEVYVCQPLGFEDPDHPDKVYKVVKALYGFYQALRVWYEILANYLLENGFQKGKIDQTLFIKKQKGDILLVQIYVDDIIFGATNKDLYKSFEKLMKDKFQKTSMGELTFFLSLQVKQKKDGIFISQDKYVAEILRKFGLTEGKSARTPIDTENHC